jgi:hypothetical protein
MRQPDGQGHERGRLITGETKHGGWILYRDTVDLVLFEISLIDTAAAIPHLLQTGDDGAGFAFEISLLTPDMRNDLPGDFWDVDAGVGGEPGGDKQDRGTYATLSDDGGHGILPEKAIDDSIAYLIAQLVRMSFSHRL